MTDAPISRSIALAATEAARDKQAADVVVLDVAELLSITDYFVICSASSSRQLKTVIEAVEDRVRHELDLRPTRREGDTDAGWLLLDYVDVVVHVFGEDERAYYNLERLWSDAPRPAWASEGAARSAG
jgi:ribosome-associated protein